MCAKKEGRGDAGSAASRVESFARPAVEALGLSLWDVEFEKAGADWDLTLYIEKFGADGSEIPVTIDDCERVSHAVDALLDLHDPITQSYNFHVSSAGLERTLKTSAQLARYIGHDVEMRLFAPINGTKQFEGKLSAASDDEVIIAIADGGEIRAPRADIARVRTRFVF